MGLSVWAGLNRTIRCGAMGWVVMAAVPAAAAPVPGIVVTPGAHGLEMKARTILPAAPASPATPRQCASYRMMPATEAGRAVAAKGWVVTGEARMGTFETVSFAARLRPASDGYGAGYCTVEQGNVGIFHGGALVAIVYAPQPAAPQPAAPQSAKASIGKVLQREGDGVRVWSGDAIGAPVADIDVTSGGIRLAGVSAQETVCAGHAVVPNIYGLPIDKARTALIASRWTPVPHKDGAPAPGQEEQLAKRGLIEVDACSEGLDFCGFDYSSGGVRLSVSTMGDATFPAVTGYTAQCS